MSRTVIATKPAQGHRGASDAELLAVAKRDWDHPDTHVLAWLFHEINRTWFDYRVLYPTDGIRWMRFGEGNWGRDWGYCWVTRSVLYDRPDVEVDRYPNSILINRAVLDRGSLCLAGTMVHEMVHAYGYTDPDHGRGFVEAFARWPGAEEYWRRFGHDLPEIGNVGE